MSDSVWPHRQQPTRLPRPWDSPGKNSGVGCHFLLQCMKVKNDSEVAQLCPTLRDPMDCSLPGSCAHGIFQNTGVGCHCLLQIFSKEHFFFFEKDELTETYCVYYIWSLLFIKDNWDKILSDIIWIVNELLATSLFYFLKLAFSVSAWDSHIVNHSVPKCLSYHFEKMLH